jgi:sucrose-6-phosphate hydrolase SacC (GH32 family)
MPAQTAQTTPTTRNWEETATMWEETAIYNYNLYTLAINKCKELQKRLDALEEKEAKEAEVTERCVNCSCSDCDD